MTIDLDSIVLERGSHKSPEDGGCLMEWASYMAGEPWSDHPACVSPVIGAFLRRRNDDLDDEGRQKLKRLIPLVVGTATGPDDESRRAWMCTDWMVRTYLPAWLSLAGMHEQAAAVAALPALADAAGWRTAEATVDAARKDAAAARAAARDAAWDAARDAAWAAARAAAGDAARAAAGDAAWEAASAAAGDAARAAAWAAAWEAAWDAARAAAWDAAGAELRPTVLSLQPSALALVERMCAVGAEPVA